MFSLATIGMDYEEEGHQSAFESSPCAKTAPLYVIPWSHVNGNLVADLAKQRKQEHPPRDLGDETEITTIFYNT